MKLYTFVLILLLLIIIIPDVFFYLKLKSKNAKPIFIFFHLLSAVFFIAVFLYIKFGLDHLRNFRVIAWVMWLYFFFLIIYIPKLLHIIFYFWSFIYKKIYNHENKYFNIIRIFLSVIVVLVMLIGAYITPRNYEVVNVKVVIPTLPTSFNGYKIILISDLHLGSWNQRFNRLVPITKLINDQKADIIVFSGDLVNNFAEETDGWTPFFLQLEAKSGKYAVLGNHDYGDYTDWKSNEMRIQNKLKIRQRIADFGFRLLLNENVYLKKGFDSISLIGVENWGKTAKTRYAKLDKALVGSSDALPKILVTHDPNHWEAEVEGKKNIALTLSGHTHAAQLGVKIGGRLYSPASLVFKHWAGLYKVNNQYIYVNRGLGYIGLPMQIGVRPEITVIELRTAKSTNH